MSANLRKFVYFWLIFAFLANFTNAQFSNCANSPCLNGGLCVAMSSTNAYCLCYGTGYEGTYCQTPQASAIARMF